jgi:hypothetical protein
MKKTLIFMIICCISQLVLAQKPKEDLEFEVFTKQIIQIQKTAMKVKSSSMLSDYIKEHPTKTAKQYAFYSACNAFIIFSIYKKELKNKVVIPEPKKQVIVNTILNNFQTSIDTCSVCRTKYKINRYEFLKEINIKPELQLSELKVLKTKGYKSEFQHADFSIQYSYSTTPWIGFSVAPVRLFTPFYRIREMNPETGKKYTAASGGGYSTTFLPLTYQYNFTNQIHDFGFSLLQIDAPIYINFTKFGSWQNTSKRTNTIYYRPEIGLGSAFFSVNYGRNYALTHRGENTIDKHIFTARFSMWAFNKYFSKKEKVEKVDFD